MKYCIESLKKVPVWRLVLAAVWLLGQSLEYYNALAHRAPPSLQEMMVSKLDNVTTLNFFFIVLLLVPELGFAKEGADIAEKPSFWRQMAYAAFLSLLIIVVYMILSLFLMLFIGGSVSLSNKWNSMEPFGFAGTPPWLAMLTAILLFFLRIVFIICLISAVNSRCRKIPYGFAAGFAVCLIDAIAYFHFCLETAVGVFPFEHNFIEAVFRLTSNMAANIMISVIYWLILIGAAGLVYRSGKLKGVD